MNSAFSREIRPAWYELSLKGDSTLCIKVHRVALGVIQKNNWDNAPALPDMKRRLNLTSFMPPREDDCGFENAFKRGASDRPDWIVWECPLPVMRKLTGDDPPPGQSNPIAIRATLWFFVSNALWLFGSEKGNSTGWKDPQLMVVEGICLPREDSHMNNGALSVTLMPPVMPWLSKHEDHTHIGPMVDAMKKAADHMWPKDPCHGRFEALFRKPKRLDLQVPGDACGLNPEWSSSDHTLDEGYTLHPHNVDSSLQQLTFLAGLARLHDLVRAG